MKYRNNSISRNFSPINYILIIFPIEEAIEQAEVIFDDDSIITEDVTESATEDTKHANTDQMLKVDVNNSCNDVCFGTSTQSPPAKRSSPRISPRLAAAAKAATTEDMEVAVYESDQDVDGDAKLAQALSKSRFNLR